jgi:hypothetical protein
MIQGRCMAIFNNVNRLSAALILPLAFLLQGCAAARMDRHLKQAVIVLEQRSDADSLAAAAVVLRFTQPSPDSVLALLVRAVSVAPERADLVWLEIQFCRETPSCDPEPEEARLRTLDPTNGAAWINAMARANAPNDEAAKLAALSALARTERIDLYWTTLIVHLTRALADSDKVSLPEALVNVIGVLAAEAIPAYSATSSLCKGDRLNTAVIAQDCRAVALAFERGDTDITEMIGVAIAKRVWPMDSPEWKAATEARRAYEYRSQLFAASSANDPQWAEKYLALCAQNRREQDVERAELIAEGKSPDPPASWTP